MNIQIDRKSVLKWLKTAFKWILVIGVASCCFMFGRCSVKEEPVKTKTDTVVTVKWDTIKIEKEKIKYQEVKFTDTLYVRDTIFIKESKLYEDSISKIWISGYQPEIDSIEYNIPYKEIKVTETIYKQKKMGLNLSVGLYGGYGIGVVNHQVVTTPEIGVGITLGYGLIIK